MKAAKGSAKSRKSRQTNAKLVRVTISLDPADYAAFENLGEKSHLSRSWLIRKAMREFLDRNPDGQALGKV